MFIFSTSLQLIIFSYYSFDCFLSLFYLYVYSFFLFILSSYLFVVSYYVEHYVAHSTLIILSFYLFVVFYYVAHYVAHSTHIILFSYLFVVFYYVAHYVAHYVALSMIEIVSLANDFIAVALREIRRYQKSIDLIIASTSFSRLMKKILHDNSDIVNRIQTSTLIVLQEACEFYVMSLLECE